MMLVQPESYLKALQKVKKSLPDLAPHLRVYNSVPEALFENVSGVLQFYSHKKDLIVIQGNTDVFNFLEPQILKLQCHWHQIHLHEITSAEKVLDSVTSDTALVLFAFDHVITGQELSFLDSLLPALQDQKVLSLGLSYRDHFFRPWLDWPYLLRVSVLNSKTILLEHGDRYKVPALWSGWQSFDEQDFIRLYNQQKKKCVRDVAVVSRFSQIHSPHWSCWSSQVGPKDHSGVLIYLPLLNADWVYHQCIERTPLPEITFVTENLLSLSPCSLNSYLSSRSGWWDQGPDLQQWRGLLWLSTALLLRYPDFAETLQGVCDSFYHSVSDGSS